MQNDRGVAESYILDEYNPVTFDAHGFQLISKIKGMSILYCSHWQQSYTLLQPLPTVMTLVILATGSKVFILSTTINLFATFDS